MANVQAESILTSSSDSRLSSAIVESFREVERNFYLKSWKTSELDAGHFVEAVRRFIELQLFGNYAPIGSNLTPLNDQTLARYLNTSGDEAYRIHIPRALLLIYGIRNKRGIGHLSQLKANQVDATMILQLCKWVMAELIRLNSSVSIEQTESLVDEIIQRNIDGVWDNGQIKRLLIEGLSLKHQILVLLFNLDNIPDQRLFEIIENGNFNYLKTTLKALHKDRQIEYCKDGTCMISPKGMSVAESVILDKKNI